MVKNTLLSNMKRNYIIPCIKKSAWSITSDILNLSYDSYNTAAPDVDNNDYNLPGTSTPDNDQPTFPGQDSKRRGFYEGY